MVDKKVVSRMLDQIGTLLELKGENRFRCIAYHNAARNIEALTTDIEELIKSDELKNVRGIGQAIAEKIVEFATTGKMKFYEELKSSIPAGVVDMLRIQGLGPKRVKILWEKLKIKSMEELQKAAQGEKLRDIAGFGEKTETNILNAIEALQTRNEKQLYPTGKAAADRIVEFLRKMKEVKNVEPAGSLRRRKEIIGDIDIVLNCQARDRAKIIERFVSHESVTSVIGRGETKASVSLKEGINCDLRLVSDAEYPFALNYFTGSKEHNVEMRSLAHKFGWSLNEYSFSKIEGMKSKNPPKCSDESDIYNALGLNYIEPELRENMDEFEAAAKNKLPNLLDFKDLYGTFHCHSNYSDGANSLDEIIQAARRIGWSYIGIADHSQIAVYANGLTPEKIREQHKEIDKLNDQPNSVRILKGTEVDILRDGSLDYSDKVLERFEYVVASIHSQMKMTQAEATKRLVKALKNKYVTMLGHPTGRLLLSRDGYPVDMLEVIRVAADLGKAIEINSHPLRLDLDWRLLRYAKEKSCRICVNPDAHNVDGLMDVQYGIGIARKGWLEKKDVVNAWELKDVMKWLTQSRSR